MKALAFAPVCLPRKLYLSIPLSAGRIDPCRLVFIDETWVKTNMTPLRGWDLKGRRLRAEVRLGIGDHDLPGRSSP